MKKHKGFTLIELLVVVLIIGILAAVALPQYQKAVDKAKFTQARMVFKTVHRAQQAFWLANGRYATNWDELADIDMPAPTSGGGEGNYIFFKWGFCFINLSYGGCGLTIAAREIQHWSSNRSTCYASRSSPRAQEICRAATQKNQSQAVVVGDDYTYAFP